MTQVCFYALKEDGRDMQTLACDLVSQAYTNKQKVAVLCASQQHAEQFDELLWQLPADRFVPHNLSGEGPSSGTPVEVCWQAQSLGRRTLLVNLSQQMINSVNNFQHIFDFVPIQEADKQAARVRYKQFQQAGCAMQFQAADN